MNLDKFIKIMDPILKKVGDMIESSTILSIQNGNFSEVVLFYKNSANLNTKRNIGSSLPLNSTSNGKLILAYANSDEVQEELISSIDFSQGLKKTITAKDKLQAEAFIIKAQGFSVEDEEFEEGIRCLSIPIFDNDNNYIAGFGVIDSTSVFTADLVPDIYGILKDEISNNVDISKL